MEDYPKFIEHISNAVKIDEKTSDLGIKIPDGLDLLRMRTEVVMDEPNEHIGWQSQPESQINAVGNIKFWKNRNRNCKN